MRKLHMALYFFLLQYLVTTTGKPFLISYFLILLYLRNESRLL